MTRDLGHIGVVVAARTDSQRLPGKVLMPLGGKPLVLFLLERLVGSRQADAIVLATSDQETDDILAKTVSDAGFEVVRGAKDDLIARYLLAADLYGFDTIVRVTGDCPFVDAETLDYCLQTCRRSDAPFTVASTKGRFPVGIDYEIFFVDSLRAIATRDDLIDDDREHLTLYFYRKPQEFIEIAIRPKTEWQECQSIWTVDYPADYDRVVAAIRDLGPQPTVAMLSTWSVTD